MIIEMTYRQWKDIYAVIGRTSINSLTDEEFAACAVLRSRVADYSFDN